MNIAIDLSTFRSYQGTEVYASHVVSHLIKYSQGNEIYIFKNKDMFPELDILVSKNPRLHIILNSSKKKISSGLFLMLYQQIVLPYRLYTKNIDVIFSPSPFVSILSGARKVIVIHDAAYKRFGEFRSFLSKIYINTMIFMARYWKYEVVTVSDFSKKELVEGYGFKESKVYNFSEGIPLLLGYNEKEFTKLQKEFSIGNKYFIYIGSPRPRKNLERILAAFKGFANKNPEYQLVILGKKDERFMDLDAEIQKNFSSSQVIVTGFVSDEQKVPFYKNSQGLIFTSLYEGFGLPIVEAQSLGIPVLTSNCTSMPEVAHDGALLVDPHSVEDMTRCIEKLALDSTLRSDLVEKGYKNIERFSWDITAQQILTLLAQRNS